MLSNDLKAVYRNICYKAILLVTVVLFSAPAFSQTKKKDKRPATDTFKTVNRLIAKKKFAKANKLLKKYNAAHPQNLNGIWLQAQVNLYTNNIKRSNNLYETAIKVAPQNDYLKLNYIHSLADMGKMDQAECKTLYAMENGGSDYSDIALLHAMLCYYQGDFKEAAAYIKKTLQIDGQNVEANNLNDLIELARSTKVSLNASYLSDDQPLTVFSSEVKAEKYFNRFLALAVTSASDYHFLQNTTSDAPWVEIGNKMFFPKAGLHLSYGVGVIRFPSDNTTGWTGNLGLNKKLSQHFDLDLSADHMPYFGTKSSIDTAISVTRLSANLNFHKNNWQAQAAFLDNIYQDNNNVYTAYAWFLAPVVVFPQGKLQMGLSTSYSNSDENRYEPVASLNDIVNNYTPNAAIAGVYNPYFTPGNEYISAALLSFNVKAGNKVDIYINGDVGYGSIYNPYLYLNKDNAGNLVLVKGYSTQYFTPYNASAAIGYHIDKTWLLTGKYTHRSTYFFNSNYVAVGVEKSFQHRKKGERADNKKSAFSKAMQQIEDKLLAVYHCKNRADLKQSVSTIRSQLVALRDAEQKRMKTTEITPGSDESVTLQDRVSGLNEMISDIDAVSLDDNEDGNDQREWLINKQYELTSIHYNGAYDEEK